MVSPVFLLSLPRSGSTLLQRILMAHPQIASTGEPWLLLPPVFAQRKKGTLTSYGHHSLYQSLNSFISTLPRMHDDYWAARRLFARELYSKQCASEEIYFLDKTPRYYLILEELRKMFPDGKYIYLFREPLSIVASMLR